MKFMAVSTLFAILEYLDSLKMLSSACIRSLVSGIEDFFPVSLDFYVIEYAVVRTQATACLASDSRGRFMEIRLVAERS